MRQALRAIAGGVSNAPERVAARVIETIPLRGMEGIIPTDTTRTTDK